MPCYYFPLGECGVHEIMKRSTSACIRAHINKAGGRSSSSRSREGCVCVFAGWAVSPFVTCLCNGCIQHTLETTDRFVCAPACMHVLQSAECIPARPRYLPATIFNNKFNPPNQIKRVAFNEGVSFLSQWHTVKLLPLTSLSSLCSRSRFGAYLSIAELVIIIR